MTIDELVTLAMRVEVAQKRITLGLVEAIRQLMNPPEPASQKKIGYLSEMKDE